MRENLAYTRTYPLEDLHVRADGTGRTVVAYAAVWNTDAEIHDRDGHYVETLAPSLFTKHLQEHPWQGRVKVMLNHGKTIYGTPSERFAAPIGTPEEITADARGLHTVTRYNRTAAADDALDMIGNGDITAQSFSGRFVDSQRTRASNRGDGLDRITRRQATLVEYGPAIFASYNEAAIEGVRMAELVETLHGLTEDERAELIELLSNAPATDLRSLVTNEAAQERTTEETQTVANETAPAGPSEQERRRRLLLLKGIG